MVVKGTRSIAYKPNTLVHPFFPGLPESPRVQQQSSSDIVPVCPHPNLVFNASFHMCPRANWGPLSVVSKGTYAANFKPPLFSVAGPIFALAAAASRLSFFLRA